MSQPTDEILLLADPRPCGIGQGEACCAFLMAGPEGFFCGRTAPGLPEQVRARLAAGTLVSKYDPGDETPYPDCQAKRVL